MPAGLVNAIPCAPRWPMHVAPPVGRKLEPKESQFKETKVGPTWWTPLTPPIPMLRLEGRCHRSSMMDLRRLETYHELASRAGVSPAVVYRWALDYSAPMQSKTRRAVEDAARAMGIDVYERPLRPVRSQLVTTCGSLT